MRARRYYARCPPEPLLCAVVTCRHNLRSEWDDVEPEHAGRKKTGDAVRDCACALVIAGRGGHTLEEVAVRLGCTRERVRQIERVALMKLCVLTAAADAAESIVMPSSVRAARREARALLSYMRNHHKLEARRNPAYLAARDSRAKRFGRAPRP